MSGGAGTEKGEEFGRRFGFVPKEDTHIVMNQDLATDLWNVIHERWLGTTDVIHDSFHPPKGLLRLVWTDWAKLMGYELDDLCSGFPLWSVVYRTLKDRFMEISKSKPHRVYELIETLCRISDADRVKKFEFEVNWALENNLSMFRLSNGRFRPVMSEVELDEVSRASALSSSSKSHIEKSLLHMRPGSSDYEASISESVKLVEDAAKKFPAGGRGVSSRLEAISSMAALHPEMKALFKKMYDFTNKCGARHANPESDYRADLGDARLVLVWCAAMANYLEARRTGAGG